MFEKRKRLKRNADVKYIVVSAYGEFLRREPSEEEISYWVERIINSEITLKEFFNSVANSDEIKNYNSDLYFDKTLDKIYKLLTGDAPDTEQSCEIKKIMSCESLVSDRGAAALRYVLSAAGNGPVNTPLHPDAQKIVFLHIPKCAGNSVMKYFEYALGGNNLLKFNFNGFLFDNEKWIDDCKPIFANAKFITGAHFDFNACEKIPGGKRIISFFREPESRILSTYYYFKSFKPSYVSSLPEGRQDTVVLNIVKACDLLSFLKSKNQYVINTIDNAVTRCLTGFFVKDNIEGIVAGNATGNDKLHEDHERTLKTAIINLNKIKAVGIMEKFDLSLNLF